MSHNVVERLWNCRISGDWKNIEALVHNDAIIYLPAQDQVLDRNQFLTLMHIMHGYGNRTEVDRIVSAGMDLGVRARVFSDQSEYRCFGFYELQEGLIRLIEEVWVTPGQLDFDLAMFADQSSSKDQDAG